MKPVSRTKFVELWQSSATLAEVAKRAHCTKGVASTRAYRLRGMGVPLKRFADIIDVQALADLAREAGE